MKSFFTLVGFVGVLFASGALSFIGIGYINDADKKFGQTEEEVIVNGEKLHGNMAMGSLSEDDLSAPPAIASVDTPTRKTRKSASRNVEESPAIETESIQSQLKRLYNEDRFVMSTVRKWEKEVKDMSTQYTLKPEVLMAAVIIDAYTGDFSKSELRSIARDHAGERVMPMKEALRNYDYGWSMNKLIDKFDLDKRFVSRSRSKAPVIESRTTAEKVSVVQREPAKKSIDIAGKNTSRERVSSVEQEFRKQVAKSMSFQTWEGLMQLGTPEQRDKAKRALNMLLMTSKVK
ncbi:MAG: hypothetical protein HUU34_01445 [Saprospiraceae bacterium]|jgi:hypothetical protein|nr:hypothetical protein [Saprospiraceae bacterium]